MKIKTIFKQPFEVDEERIMNGGKQPNPHEQRAEAQARAFAWIEKTYGEVTDKEDVEAVTQLILDTEAACLSNVKQVFEKDFRHDRYGFVLWLEQQAAARRAG